MYKSKIAEFTVAWHLTRHAVGSKWQNHALRLYLFYLEYILYSGGLWKGPKIRLFWHKAFRISFKSWRWTSPFSTITTKTIHPCHSWLRNKIINVLEWFSQSPDLKRVKYLWCGLKKAVHTTCLVDLEGFCKTYIRNMFYFSCSKISVCFSI